MLMMTNVFITLAVHLKPAVINGSYTNVVVRYIEAAICAIGSSLRAIKIPDLNVLTDDFDEHFRGVQHYVLHFQITATYL